MRLLLNTTFVLHAHKARKSIVWKEGSDWTGVWVGGTCTCIGWRQVEDDRYEDGIKTGWSLIYVFDYLSWSQGFFYQPQFLCYLIPKCAITVSSWLQNISYNKSTFFFSRGLTVWPLLHFFAVLRVGEKSSPSFTQVHSLDAVADKLLAVFSDISHISSGSLTVLSPFCYAAIASFTDWSSCNRGHVSLTILV